MFYSPIFVKISFNETWQVLHGGLKTDLDIIKALFDHEANVERRERIRNVMTTYTKERPLNYGNV